MTTSHAQRTPGAAPVAALLALVLALPAVAPPARATGALDPLNDPLVPQAAGGTARVDRLLAKLEGHRRLLVVGAHPDDEDTTLLAYVARGLGGEAAYLSLSRGEGGQNLIGPELGVGLGLLRSRELLAARGVDGARQFFTRAYDFGYTRSIEETLERWPREVLLPDVVRVVRRFKPQVVVAVFPPDERAGHGQHQASGIVAGEAFELAGDPGAFPELAAEGLAPWRPEAFYRGAWWRPEDATVEFPLGVVEPVSGRSIFQIAMASRSQHRCQDMGMLQPLGPFEGRLAWERGAGAPAGEEGEARSLGGDVFAGIDTSPAAIAAPLVEPTRSAVAAKLAEAGELARAARAGLTAADPRAVLPAAAAIHRALAEARALLPAAPAAGRAPAAPGPEVAVAELIDEKLAVAAELVAAAAGIGFDAVTDRELLVPGSAFEVEAAAWDAAGAGAELLGIELVSADGLVAEPVAVPERDRSEARFRGAGADPERGYHLHAFAVRVPAAAAPTVPYFLERPLDGDLYDWSAAPAALRGEPFGPPPLSARFRLRVAGEEIALDREVVHRFRDQELGEVRRALRVVPAVELAAARELVVWPTEPGAPRTLEATVLSHAPGAVAGRVEAAVPAGWPPVEPAPFTLPAAGARATVRLTLSPPADFAPGDYALRLAAVADGVPGGRYDLALPLVDYPHVRATPNPQPAAVRIAAADLALPPLGRVGYVRGASDLVPEALADVGVPVELLGPGDLATGDLGRFDAIVVGARAYETDPALAASNPRLLDYARGGGLVIVQYQQYQYSNGGYAPYTLEIARPHGRVFDEEAPVTVLEPASPVFQSPNPIGDADWRGWVQERGLYMPAAWDEPFRPLLEMADPGGEPQRGALLVAPVGEGTYVYTGLAFFRQLPAGVPGAYRLFANLLALAAPGGTDERAARDRGAEAGR